MGMFKLFSSCECEEPQRKTKYIVVTEEEDSNPNPRNFHILRSAEIGRFTILLVEYPDCHNYEGKKILVFEHYTAAKLKHLSVLDPHFCDSITHPSPIARFVPTAKGWRWAELFCSNA